MRGCGGLAAILLLFGMVSPLWAQRRDVTGSTELNGRVRESDGRGVRRAEVCTSVDGYRICTDVDSTGVYRLAPLPRGSLLIEVTCNVRMDHPFFRVLASDSVDLGVADAAQKDWTVSTVSCDQRVVRRVEGVFRGHYSAGFEESSFVPCPSDAWFVPGDSLHIYQPESRNAWVTVPEGMTWPDLGPRAQGDVPRGYAEYYLVIRGTIVGPKPSGHLGVSPFELLADSILEMRWPAEDDCA